MALLSKKEFADQCGIPTNNLSVQISRGKVVLTDAGMIDTANDKNRAFWEKRLSKKSTDSENAEQTASALAAVQKKAVPVINFTETNTEDNSPESIPAFVVSERKLKHLDTQKRAKEIEKLELEIEKKKGEVIPSELIKPVFLQHNQHILHAMKNADEEILTHISHKYSITAPDMAYMRGKSIEIRNAAMQKATDSSIKSIANIINEFAEKRSAGQKA
jgi:hypothetical protein